MNLKLYVLCIAAILTLAAPSLADSNNTAKIRGEVYSWNTFEPLKNVVVEVNSTPSQSIVAKYSVYYFELAPGNYSITAKYYQNKTLLYSGEETVEIKDNGNYTKDLLLLPVYSEDLMDSSEENELIENPNTVNEINNSDKLNKTEGKNIINSSTVSSLLIAFLLLVLLAGGYQLSKKNKKIDEDQLQRVKKEHTTKEHLVESTEFFSKPERPESVPEDSNKFLNETSELEARKNFQEKTLESTEESINASTEKTGPISQPVKESEARTTVLKQISGQEQPPEHKTFLATPTLKSEPEISEQKATEERKREDFVQEEALSESEPEEEIEIVAFEAENNLERQEGEGSPIIEISVPENGAPARKKKLPLPADLQEVMDIIRGQGGRITQKDLRSKLKYSEGKVSLMIADLERRELLEKFKRGRGNVIILKDEER